ncbi:MAG TPA: proton-conducting transporter membrane subunit, partial [Actinomycetota bacterium]|nr:proton-conducting transporter membrane subunit [Actinomycetota bacterium]
GAIIHITGKTKLSEMGGLWRSQPFLTAAFIVAVAAIAGVPPLNGYASRELIDEAVLHSHQIVPFLALSLGEILTFAALARAVWLGFLRPRTEKYDQDAPLPKGMAISFGVLSALCLAFGVAPRSLIGKLMAPAAAGFLEAGRYAGSVLRPHFPPPSLAIPHIAFPFITAQGLATTLVTLAAGGLIAWWWLRVPERVPEPAPVRVLRALHTGSVNDYAGYAVLGLVGAMVFLEASVR